jgi:TP901 family phage tail tape measure protein
VVLVAAVRTVGKGTFPMKAFAIGMILKAIDQVSGPLTGIGGNVANFQKKVGTSAVNVSNAWHQTGQALASLGLRAAAVGGGIFAIAKTTATYGADTEKMANILGMSTDALQSFRYVGKMADVDIEDMDTALKKFTVNLGKSADGGGIAKGALHALGITAKELKAAGPDKTLMVIADKFSKIKDPSIKAALAVELFGKNGAGMVNVLSGGSKSIKEMQDRAKALGIVLDQDGIRSAEEFENAWKETTMTLGSLKNILGVAVMPTIKNGMESITKWIVKTRAWAKENPELAKTLLKVGAGFAGLVIFGGPLLKTGLSIVNLVLALSKLKSVIGAAGGLGKLLSGFGPGAGKFLLIAAVIGIAAYLIYKNWDKIGPVLKKTFNDFKPWIPAIAGATLAICALNIAMGLNPVGAIIIGVSLLISGLIYLVKNWDKVKETFSKSLKDIGGFFTSVWDGIKLGASSVFDWLKKSFFTVADGILTVFGGIIKTVLGAAGSIGKLFGIDTSGLDAVIGKINDLQTKIHGQSFFADQPGQDIRPAVSPGSIVKPIITPFSKIRDQNPITLNNQITVPFPSRPAAMPTKKVETGIGARAQTASTQRQVNDSSILVKFQDLPRGTKVTPEKVGGNLQLDIGYAGAAY